MATYHQYSEIVAAYGYKLPPPPRPQGTRLTLPLLYAAVGVVLGTFTGTALAVASLHPGASATSHLSFASSSANGPRIHPIANAGQQPVIQNHTVNPIASAPAPAIETQPAKLVIVPAASTPMKAASIEPVHAKTPVVRTHAAAPAVAIVAPVVHKQVSVEQASIAHASVQPKPAVQLSSAAPVHVQPKIAAAGPAAIAAVDPPSLASAQTPSLNPSLDGGFKAQVFYSEGDATVADYSAAEGTIQTDDGRTFQIGTTVNVSTAMSWTDYRANVHFRCDQNGNCSLMRAGVIAPNAKLI
jgi:hypothetical protein